MSPQTKAPTACADCPFLRAVHHKATGIWQLVCVHPNSDRNGAAVLVLGYGQDSSALVPGDYCGFVGDAREEDTLV